MNKRVKWFYIITIIVIILFAFYKRADYSLHKELLLHYNALNDSLKRDAVDFIFSNSDGQIIYIPVFIDKDGKEIQIHFDTINSEDSLFSFLSKANIRSSFKAISLKNQLNKEIMISTIDLSFKVWNKYPWAQKVPKDIFFNYILSPNIYGENLDNWRTILYEKYSIIADSLVINSININNYNINYLCDANWMYYTFVAEKLSKWLIYDPSSIRITPIQGFDEIKAIGKINCMSGSYMGVYLMRALGLPSTVDFVPLWGSRNSGHASEVFWNDSIQSFMTPKERELNTRYPAKVFRFSYEKQNIWTDSIKKVVGAQSFLLEYLMHDNWLDVTAKHNKTVNITYHFSKTVNSSFAYICVYNYGNWVPLYWGKIDRNNNVIFQNMGSRVLYRVAIPNKSGFILQDNIIQVDSLGNITDNFSPSKFLVNLKLTKLNTGSEAWIKKGHSYSLYYYNNLLKWEHIQTQRSFKDSILYFNSVPSNCYYRLLKSNEESTLERIFTYDKKNELQIWW